MNYKILILLLVTYNINASNNLKSNLNTYSQIIDAITAVVQRGVDHYTRIGAQQFEELGSLVVTGDFNGDHNYDVAISIPGYSSNGAVMIMYGSLLGLTTTNTTFLSGISTHTGDGFGYSLAVGDFNGDGDDDLAVGIPFYEFGGSPIAGIVQIYHGSPTGLTSTFSIAIGTGQGQPERFGYSMTSGDYNGDGNDDLAVSSPYKTFNGVENAGEVRVYNGTTSGITVSGFLTIRQGSNGVFGFAEADDLFGYSLTSGDFDKDELDAFYFDDLAIGVPYEDLNAIDDGIVQVFSGSPAGLVYSSFWSQVNVSDDAPENFDQFGQTLTTGNINGSLPSDLADELIIGVPMEDIGSVLNAGVVHVFYGSSSGLVEAGNQTFSQATSGIFGSIEAEDKFGYALATGNINPDTLFDIYDDIFIGVPFESYLATNDGVVHVILGGEMGADASDSLFIVDTSFFPEDDTNFGYSLAVASYTFYDEEQYNRSLLIGLPGSGLLNTDDTGSLAEFHYIANKIFKDSFE